MTGIASPFLPCSYLVAATGTHPSLSSFTLVSPHSLQLSLLLVSLGSPKPSFLRDPSSWQPYSFQVNVLHLFIHSCSCARKYQEAPSWVTCIHSCSAFTTNQVQWSIMMVTPFLPCSSLDPGVQDTRWQSQLLVQQDSCSFYPLCGPGSPILQSQELRE